MRTDRDLEGISIFMGLFHVFPPAGFAASIVLFGLGAYLKWIQPELLRGFAPLIGLFCWVMAIAALAAALFGLLERRPRRGRLRSLQCVEDIQSCGWREFEQLVADAFRRQGYRVEECGGARPDGGVDLILRDSKGAEYLVQCKQHRVRDVGEPKLREFYGAMAAYRTRCEGVFVTSGRFTEPARRFASDKPIRLIDGEELVRLINSTNPVSPAVSHFMPPDREPSALSEGLGQLHESPLCPKCRVQMVRRVARQGKNVGKEFWGCRNFPNCRQTMSIQD